MTLSGELGLNFFITANELDVENGAKAVLEGPDGKREIELNTLAKTKDGEYKLTYMLKAIFADRKVSLKLVDSNGATIKLYRASDDSEFAEDVFEYGIYDYAKDAGDAESLTAAQKNLVTLNPTNKPTRKNMKYSMPTA